MIWADRVGVVWGAIFYAALWWFTATTPQMPIGIGDAIWAGVVFVGFPWLVLRGLDFILTGGLRWHPMHPHGKSL